MSDLGLHLSDIENRGALVSSFPLRLPSPNHCRYATDDLHDCYYEGELAQWHSGAEADDGWVSVDHDGQWFDFMGGSICSQQCVCDNLFSDARDCYSH